jgi:two-component system phosphate regulon sensor histidine kinase PhoR
MNVKRHTWVLYLIVVTIIATISVQFYWNFKNYEQNKQRVINEIRLSLDNSIEEYFSELVKEDITTVINLNGKSKNSFSDLKFDSIFSNNNHIKKLKNKINNDSLTNTKPRFSITNISISSDEKLSKEKTDSILKGFNDGVSKRNTNKISSIKVETNSTKNLQFFKGKKAADSLKLIKSLKPIFFSITSSFIEYEKLDSLLTKQLENKGILTEYKLNHLKNDTIFFASKKHLPSINLITVDSKSTFLKSNEEFKLQFKNPTLEALKRSSSGIILSLLLSLAVISSLFYLLKIINQQKELAIVKNDLISNITHEFKTPIATVSTAIEAIENFNVLDDKEKTKKYLAMSSIQLKKLHLMVEKLLETATLDSEQLILKKENIDIVEIIEKQVTKHQLITKDKEILFSSNIKPIYLNIDIFHFENVLSNLVDNAIKYGGNKIEININSILNSVEISVADNGQGIDKNLQDRIFDKFYRIPKGNTHDVKGFGIGLYYSKKIIEKHNGLLNLEATKTNTIFKITMPNE